MAAEEGFEPSHTESESAVLPLHNSAINCNADYYSEYFRFVKAFFDFCGKIFRKRNFLLPNAKMYDIVFLADDNSAAL